MEFPNNITDKRLKIIAQKVYSNTQVNFDDAVYMLNTNHFIPNVKAWKKMQNYKMPM